MPTSVIQEKVPQTLPCHLNRGFPSGDKPFLRYGTHATAEPTHSPQPSTGQLAKNFVEFKEPKSTHVPVCANQMRVLLQLAKPVGFNASAHCSSHKRPLASKASTAENVGNTAHRSCREVVVLPAARGAPSCAQFLQRHLLLYSKEMTEGEAPLGDPGAKFGSNGSLNQKHTFRQLVLLKHDCLRSIQSDTNCCMAVCAALARLSLAVQGAKGEGHGTFFACPILHATFSAALNCKLYAR